MAQSSHAIGASNQVLPQSAVLMPHASPEAALHPARQQMHLADDLARGEATTERRETEALRHVACSLRSAAQEARLVSQETRWNARATRFRAAMERERSHLLGQWAGYT
ncbi:MAG TPA: hypothetical protein VFL55_19695 [Acetobacteraceae bacterium]|nr:hypothetical protein [Acetobacteraceae bacterium]